MTLLSELLKQDRPFVRRSVPAEPVEVRRAGENIRRRWPGVETVDPETDPETLASEMERRHRTGDWREFYWLDVTRTACALLDSDLWRDRRFAPLFDFLLDQIGPGTGRPANGPYVRAMFRKYLDTFDPASGATRGLAKALKEHWPEAALPIGTLVHHFRIFDLDTAPPQTVAAYMDNQDEPFRALREAGMEAPHGTGLMEAAHLHFVSKLAPRIRNGDLDAAEKLLDWIDPPDLGTPLQGPGAGKAMDALLLPWCTRDPEPALKKLLETRLVSAYGDPRINVAGIWAACSGEARLVMLKWLAGATIKVFFDIVTQADSSHMWSDRKDLWNDLYEEGRVTQAWFALSYEGAAIARRLDRGREGIGLTFARNKSQSAQDRQKCLLLMDVDGRWVVEGSHNFPTWVFPRRSLTTFRPYEKSYTCDQFRYIAGPEQPERIVHLGAWRNKVLTALQR